MEKERMGISKRDAAVKDQNNDIQDRGRQLGMRMQQCLINIQRESTLIIQAVFKLLNNFTET